MRVEIAEDRATLLRGTRQFFEKRGLLEVDCGALMVHPPNDAHIEVMSTQSAFGKTRYLHTSPEYAMKKLLASGFPDLYYLGHVFRYGDVGPMHAPEFTLVEWYRKGFSLHELMHETGELISLFLGELPLQVLGYCQAFRELLGIVDVDEMAALQKCAKQWDPIDVGWSRTDYRQFLLSHGIEPHLGKKGLTALIEYPEEEAALACVVHGKAERFEIYHQGVELCNGFHELADPKELERRFHIWNQGRKEAYPIDEVFLQSLSSLPDCSGVSVGFDRLMSLRHKTDLHSVIH